MRRSYIYSDVAEKGSGILHLEKKSGLALFNTRGGLIPVGNVIIDGDSKVVWTLGAICRLDTSLQSRPGLIGVGIKNQAAESLTSDSDYATDLQILVSNEHSLCMTVLAPQVL